jgi:hypothetical protein
MSPRPTPGGSLPDGSASFDAVLRDLRHIRDTARDAQDRNGYFAALYAQVTAAVALRCADGRFDDAARMEELVDRFARRYTDAYRAHAADLSVMRAWELAFQTARSSEPLVVQHLLLGINAHINLDLGVVVADMARARSVPMDDLAPDFGAINDVLAELTDRCQAAVVAGSPLLAAADVLLGDHDEALTRFSLRVARDGAWEFATQLSRATVAGRDELIDRRDASVADVGRRLLTRAGPLHTSQRLARTLEWSSVRQVIDRLAAVDVS